MSHQMKKHAKRIAGIALTAGLCLSGGSALASPLAEGSSGICWIGGVAVSRTTMYDQADTTGNTLGTIPQGKMYTVCSDYGHTNYAQWPYWIQVQYNNTVGWVRVDQLYGAHGNQNNQQQNNQQQNNNNQNQNNNQNNQQPQTAR